MSTQPTTCTCGAKAPYIGATPCHLDFCEVVRVWMSYRYRPLTAEQAERRAAKVSA